MPTGIAAGEFKDMSMCGISGGGYTTTVYAALDPRIRYSFSVAGSMPHPLREVDEVGWEDDESQSIFNVCPMHVMYLLSSVGQNGSPRGHYQLYNFEDDVFGASDGRVGSYRLVVQDSVQRLGGHFDVFVDKHSAQHHITDFMQKRILEVVGLREQPTYDLNKATVNDQMHGPHSKK